MATTRKGTTCAATKETKQAAPQRDNTKTRYQGNHRYTRILACDDVAMSSTMKRNGTLPPPPQCSVGKSFTEISRSQDRAGPDTQGVRVANTGGNPSFSFFPARRAVFLNSWAPSYRTVAPLSCCLDDEQLQLGRGLHFALQGLLRAGLAVPCLFFFYFFRTLHSRWKVPH